MLLASLLLLQSVNLFSIGTLDHSPLEFRLAPNNYHSYQDDSLYIVGRSNDKDWNYVLPGPDDRWAGGREHEAVIAFDLAIKKPTTGNAELTIDQSDAHYASPPHLQIVLNGKVVGEADAFRGQSDDTLDGKQTHGTLGEIKISIPGEDFKWGINTLSIRNVSGSWYIFDALSLTRSTGTVLGIVPPSLLAEPLPQMQAILKTTHGPRQPASIHVTNFGAAGIARVSGVGVPSQTISLRPGVQVAQIDLPVTRSMVRRQVTIIANGIKTFVDVTEAPVRPWTVYLCPHSHLDIGYTDLQKNVLALHERNIGDALEVAKESRNYPPDARFRFNIEATWPVYQYTSGDTSRQQINEMMDGFANGSLHLSASFANELTGIMNPEEVMQSYRYSDLLNSFGAKFPTASQTDVPGITWGSVTAMHEAGIKYLFLMPNAIDRIGGVNAWMNKPFWWLSPSGNERVLVWEPDTYSVGTSAEWDGDRTHIIHTNHPTTRFIDPMIFVKLDHLTNTGYPYDMIAEPWSVTDNAPVDGDVPKAVKAWNEKYAIPHVITATLTEACQALEKKYGDKLPKVRGDLTPYWEDGSGSSARETGENRQVANRLLDAETLYAIENAKPYPSYIFLTAWSNVLLYSEHTWGAWNSISDPNDPQVIAEWKTKQSYVQKAESYADTLLTRATPRAIGDGPRIPQYINTLAWTRDALVPTRETLTDRVVDQDGRPVPTQRSQAMGPVALFKGIRPTSPFGVSRESGTTSAHLHSPLSVQGTTITNRDLSITVDPKTGAVSSWKTADGTELIDQHAKYQLGQYLYLVGDNLANIQTLSNPKVEVLDKGPLVASIRITGDAPGARSVTNLLEVIADLNEVRWTTTIDKLPVLDKEAVHIAFPFNIPTGQMRIEMPWAWVRPEIDQVPGANKNWLPIDNCVDVSNKKYGVTCVSLDAPLLEVGEISANLLGSQTDPLQWRQHIAQTSTFFSWALNNHWHTNYVAEQSGKLVFRYVMKSHGPFDPAQAAKFGVEAARPPIASGAYLRSVPALTVSDPSVLVTRLVPTDDGKAILVRLWNPTSNKKHVTLGGRLLKNATVWKSDISEAAMERLSNRVVVRAKDVLTLRIGQS